MRCEWARTEPCLSYHDNEWGKPVFDDTQLFEMLTLEGAQAGLSWETVLKKREGYRLAFKGFDIDAVSSMTTEEAEALMQNPGIVRNRLKISSTIDNARAIMQVQAEFGSFSAYLWGFTDGQVIDNQPGSMADVPSSSPLSDRLSKDLKKRGFRFVGTTICYAFLQATGVVNDHTVDCHCRTTS
jgi:DNA-3-methyladenine glycosylase I